MRAKTKYRQRPGLFRLFIMVAVVVFMLIYMDYRFTVAVGEMAKSRAKIEAVRLVNDSILKVMGKTPNLCLVDVVKDDAGKIVSIESNIGQISRVKTEITAEILQKMKSMPRESLRIPIGNLTGNALLSARGPAIDCRFIPTGSVLIQTISKFDSCGINQTRHQIVVSVEATVSAFTSFKNVSVTVPTEFVLAETIIVGSVPQNYTHVLTSDKEWLSQMNDYKAGTP
ncbi:MAG: sporulation protein YunB [Oscillospiraceae bacterium]